MLIYFICRLLSLNNTESHGSQLALDDLRKQLIQKDVELNTKQNQLREIEDSHELELNILKSDLQCAKIEQKLAAFNGLTRSSTEPEDRSTKIKELTEILQKLRKESERMRQELTSKKL